MILLDFEKEILNNQKGVTVEVSDAAINEKYEKGEARIITEQGAVKLSLVKQVFNAENYQLRPKYQRRITWDSKKRSKLIESFIMNIPVPPIFVYETDFNRYQVMDGLQRITAIMDFYNDYYELEELTQWPELNGKKYSQLPQKVKEGIDRRQLSFINPDDIDGLEDELDNYDDALKYAKNKLYKRMYDVELVLRYFAMRHIDEYSGKLSEFMDLCLRQGNRYTDNQIEILKNIFEKTIEKADILFSEKAFCQYVKRRGTFTWTSPQKMIYDSMMLALNQIEISNKIIDLNSNIERLKKFYQENEDAFDGKRQSKGDIKHRTELFISFIKELLG